MSRPAFYVLAALVTLGGMAAVAWGARQIAVRAARQRRALTWGFLLAYIAVLVLRPEPWPIIDLAVMVGAVGGALLLERSLVTPGSVAVFLAVAAAVDLFSMSGGLSSAIIERYRNGSSNLLLYLALVVPIAGRTVPIVGIGDLFVGGAVATALLRLGLRPLAIATAIAVGMLVALAYGLWRGGAPALPFLAVTVALLVWRQSRGAGDPHRTPAAG